MKIIIAGSRNIWPSQESITEQIYAKGWIPSAIVCGMATGADSCGRLWAKDHGIECIEMPADWARHGKSAGPKRNRQMAIVADAALVFWDGKSSGSASMIREMKALDKPVHVVIFGKNDNE